MTFPILLLAPMGVCFAMMLLGWTLDIVQDRSTSG